MVVERRVIRTSNIQIGCSYRLIIQRVVIYMEIETSKQFLNRSQNGVHTMGYQRKLREETSDLWT